jgi:hypothetical protein
MAAEGAATKAKTSVHTIFGWLQYVADQTSQGQTPTLTRHRRRGVMETTWLDAGFSRRRSFRRA